MKEVSFLPGEQIIREGDDGDCPELWILCLLSTTWLRVGNTFSFGQDFLCLIEEGNPECKKLIDGEEKAWNDSCIIESRDRHESMILYPSSFISSYIFNMPDCFAIDPHAVLGKCIHHLRFFNVCNIIV